jgi:hypothetical protein
MERVARRVAVGAGGAFSMLVDDRENPPELSEARRFAEPWERRASAELRAGSPGAVDAYLGHGRVAEGNRDEMLAACFAAWKADVEAGKSSLILAGDNATVTELNRLARAGRVAPGQVTEQGLPLLMGRWPGWATSSWPGTTTVTYDSLTASGCATGTALSSRPPIRMGP